MTNKELGDRGEIVAKKYLLNQSYKILAHNYRTQHLEIDLIAQYKKYTVFIEVKTRIKTAASAEDNPLGKRQVNNLKRAINEYCFKNYIKLELTRLDLIIVLVDQTRSKAEIKHYRDIF